jgi:hypothetical protein
MNPLQDWHTRSGRLELPEAVAIVGQAPRQWADYAGADVWVINGPDFPPTWHILWQLHGIEHIDRRHGTKDPHLLRRLRTIGERDGQRLFMTPDAVNDPRSSVGAPHAEAYPIHELAGRLLTGHAGAYLTGSIPIMIAHAVELEVEHIILDGMRFTSGSTDWWEGGEGWMVPCTEWHLGRAQARGVTVEVNHGSGLFRGAEWVYGFEGPGSI